MDRYKICAMRLSYTGVTTFRHVLVSANVYMQCPGLLSFRTCAFGGVKPISTQKVAIGLKLKYSGYLGVISR